MRKSIATIAPAIAVAALAATGVACGSDSPTENAAGDSAYCEVARKWAVHELDPRDDNNPAWLKQYWAEYEAFTQDAQAVAPAELRDDWKVYVDGLARQKPVFEKYGYDGARAEQEATEEEMAVFEPNEAQQQAFQNVLRYEALTCDAGQPPAADVDFSSLKAGKYCDLLAKDNERIMPVMGSGSQPADVKRVMLDPDNEQTSKDFIAAAPAGIAADVRKTVEWEEEHQLPTAKKYGFDIRKVLLEGSAQERRDLQSTDPRIRDHFARVAAYEQQVCGAENF